MAITEEREDDGRVSWKKEDSQHRKAEGRAFGLRLVMQTRYA